LERLTNREYDALTRMLVCRHRFEVKGNLIRIGTITLKSLVKKGLAEEGWNDRHNSPGWAITNKGREALAHGTKMGWCIDR